MEGEERGGGVTGEEIVMVCLAACMASLALAELVGAICLYVADADDRRRRRRIKRELKETGRARI